MDETKKMEETRRFVLEWEDDLRSSIEAERSNPTQRVVCEPMSDPGIYTDNDEIQVEPRNLWCKPCSKFRPGTHYIMLTSD